MNTPHGAPNSHPTLVSEIVHAEQPPSGIRNRAHLQSLVALPLLPACEYLYDCNIPTIESSIYHGKGYAGEGFINAWIQVDWRRLSFENRAIGRTIGTYGVDRTGPVLDLFPAFTHADRIDDAQRIALELVHPFQKQPLLEPFYTREDVLRCDDSHPRYVTWVIGGVEFSIPSCDPEIPNPHHKLENEALAEACGYLYDARTELFTRLY